MLKVPDHVKKIIPYVPGKPIDELERELGVLGSIKLASNENPLGPSPLAIEAVKTVLPMVNLYPDGGGHYLKSALSGLLGVGMENIVLGQGSNELLDIAVRTFLSPGDETVMADPSFIVYYNSSAKAGGSPIKVALTADHRHDLKAMSGHICEKTKIVFIANPNNPTGTIVSSDEFGEFMDSVPEHVAIIVDEAYHEYVTDRSYPDTMKYFMREAPVRNILILRTFSKIYGLAGLRIGYGIASGGIVREMDKVREPFNTSSVAQAAAVAALRDVDHLDKSLALNEEGKKFLYGALSDLASDTSIEYVPTQGNFIYVDLKRDAVKVYDKLLRKGIIVRPMGKTAIRVTIGLKIENEAFIRSLKEVLIDGHNSFEAECHTEGNRQHNKKT
ncbi:MAG: histidinol-phosphate transaminase [Nitrospirae bacterium]|nr:histidinol-phosphate transaminase [Nitrospirota bacterium]